MGMNYENSMGYNPGRRNYRQANKRNAADNLPGMQRATKKQNGPVFIGDVQGNGRGLEMLALCIRGRRVL